MNRRNIRNEDDRLNAARLAIGNALNTPYIAQALAQFGYDSVKLKQGESLMQTAEKQFANRKKEYGEQYAATDALQASYDQAQALYMKHVKLARVALKEKTHLWEPLQLQGERKKSLSGWLAQAGVFYGNALTLEEIKGQLATLNIDEAALTQGKAQVDQVAEALAVQKKEIGKAQAATEAKDRAMDAMDGWMSDFRAVVRIALEDEPQYLEALGILAPS